MKPVNKNPDAAELKTFGRVMLGGFTVLSLLLWYLSIKTAGVWWPQGGVGWQGSTKQVISMILLATGLMFWLVSIVSLQASRLLYVGWMTVATYMGLVSTTIVLTLLYFVVLPVFSLIRLTDPLRVTLRSSGSYWEDPKPHEATLERMSRPF